MASSPEVQNETKMDQDDPIPPDPRITNTTSVQTSDWETVLLLCRQLETEYCKRAREKKTQNSYKTDPILGKKRKA